MKNQLIALLYNPFVRVGLWTVVCIILFIIGWQTAQVPANARAEELTLAPLYDRSQSIDLSGLWLPKSGDKPATTVFISTSGGRLLVSLSDGRYTYMRGTTEDKSVAGKLTLKGAPDAPALSRALLGRLPTEEEAPAFRELAEMLADAEAGWRTDVEHFRIERAMPHERPRWWRGRYSWPFVIWICGAAFLWRWPEGGNG
jgi:hypothetical protein